MAFGPQPSDIPLIRRVLAVYKVSSVLTGTFLLGLVVMMVTRYGFGVDIEFNGASGQLLALTDPDAITGVNVSILLLAVHGWLYVLYLACDFLLWRLLRWPFWKFVWIAMGGIVPLLSFFFGAAGSAPGRGDHRRPRGAHRRVRLRGRYRAGVSEVSA